MGYFKVVGLSVYNNKGTLQITSQFKNLQFANKVSLHLDKLVTVGEGDPVRDIGSCAYEVTNDSKKSLFAARCEDNKFITWQFGVWTFKGARPRIDFRGKFGAEITLYEFTYDVISPGEHFEIRNEHNEVVFSDQGRFMKVIDARFGTRESDFSDAAIGTVLGGTQHSTNIKTAVAIGNLCMQYNSSSYAHRQYEARQSFIFLPDKTESVYSLYSRFMPPYEYYRREIDLNFSYIVIDVTDL